MTNYLAKAIRIAASAHENQTDKGGNAYILHPIRIMQRLRSTDEELMQIAILHDVAEDTEWTLEQLELEGFSQRVIAALELLSHRKEDTYEAYIKKISSNIDAIRVKIEDLRDNSDITRLKGLRKKDFERIEKYNRAFVFLTEAVKYHTIVYG